VTDERAAEENDRAREARVEALAREIAETINAGQVEGREILRDVAINLLRDEVQPIEVPAAAAPAATGTFNSFGIGIPLILMGGVMVFLFPPVGLLMFAVAAVMIAWGVVTTLLARN
jgi:hypothetical protein